MTTETRNEAAERLLDVMGELRHLQANERTALRNSIRAVIHAERRATVERIRARLLGESSPVDALYERHTSAILDAEAAR